ncbi:MAG: glycosyltransferase, partial [Acidimicrobiales bacterium]
MLIATTVSQNHLPYARVLARSFLAHHPGGRVVALVVDPQDGWLREDEPFEVVTLGQLPVDPREWRRMAAMYDVVGLCCALKPVLLRYLVVDCGEETATYLDSDIEVFGPLDDLDAAAREHSLVLTPHRPGPLTPGVPPIEFVFARAGSYNAGFVAASRDAVPFLDWWAERCRRECIDAPSQGLLYDQVWLDLATTYFPCHPVQEPGYNTGYWNLDCWPLRLGSGDAEPRFLVGDAPLRFFHFSGFSPDVPHMLTAHQGPRPWLLLSQDVALRELCAGYVARLEDEGLLEYRKLPYLLGQTANGMLIDGAMRAELRAEVLRREQADTDAGGVDDVPDPFDDREVERYVELLRSPSPGGEAPRLSRYLYRRYLERPDLQRGFPDLTGTAANHFLWWVHEMGHRDLAVPSELVPAQDDLDRLADPEAPDDEPTDVSAAAKPGIRLVGYLTTASALGTAARAAATALDVASEAYVTVAPADPRRPLPGVDHPSRVPHLDSGDVDLICSDPAGTWAMVDRLGPRLSPAGRSTIGLWSWAVEDFPAGLCPAAELVDEVWACSEHAGQAIRRALTDAGIPTPVHVVPPGVVEQQPTPRRPPVPGLPDGFVFLSCLDFLTGVERRNPYLVIDAFCQAFGPDEGPYLLIKTINGSADVPELERLRLRVVELGRPDIEVRDGRLDPADHQALIAACDAYVSLHRAESFGFTLAEAMLLAKPVIATAYSGNLEFMDEHNSYLVEHSMTTIGPGADPYPASSRWADPSLDAAAAAMRRVVGDPAGAEAVADRARRDIQQHHSPAARAPLWA